VIEARALEIVRLQYPHQPVPYPGGCGAVLGTMVRTLNSAPISAGLTSRSMAMTIARASSGVRFDQPFAAFADAEIGEEVQLRRRPIHGGAGGCGGAGQRRKIDMRRQIAVARFVQHVDELPSATACSVSP